MAAQKTYSLEKLFRALADSTRLRLLNLMNGREVCVCYFVEILKTSQPKISRHLAYLRRAGIVASRREGKWMHYRLMEPIDPIAATILRDVISGLDKDRELLADRKQLITICCSPAGPEVLRNAPAPLATGRRAL